MVFALQIFFWIYFLTKVIPPALTGNETLQKSCSSAEHHTA